HDVPAQDVLAGAFELAAAFSYFPQGTTFVAVVDPGVGSSRLAIAAEAGGYRFVGPDNGIFSLVFRRHAPDRVVELSDPRFLLPNISRTFEGRDRFAPAAAWLSEGADLARMGPPIHEWVRLAIPEPHVLDDSIDGAVIKVDRFGNLITNIDRATLNLLAAPATRVEVAGTVIEGLIPSYAHAPAGQLCALVSSADFLEIACARGSAFSLLDAGVGAPVHVTAGA
ncbi:MAG: S-adenosyl-l-methionine hydroxide adenosyltransferase family protein, partial [Vicinamibacterales bacterium]